jgi:hypothetical protein
MTLPCGASVEVKTQVRWVKENSFTVSKTKTNNNIKKCVEVDRLIFVEPGRSDNIRFYECVDRSYSTILEEFTNSERYLFDIKKMKLIKTVKNKKVCNAMIKLSKTNKLWLV